MNKISIATITIVLLSGLIGATPFLIEETSVSTQERSLNTSLTVEEPKPNQTSLGINAERSLDFGKMSPNTNATKFLNISSNKKAILDVSSDGNISQILDVRNRFYFEGAKEIPVEVRAKEPGNYTGKINLDFQLPKNRVGGRWLDLKHNLSNLL